MCGRRCTIVGVECVVHERAVVSYDNTANRSEREGTG